MTPNLPKGVWSAPSDLNPEELHYLFVDPGVSRMITFALMSISPVKRAVLRHWYEQGEPGLVRARLNPAGVWTMSPYKIDGPVIYWTNYGEKHPWTWVPPENIPEWIPEKVLKAYAKMDLLQKETDEALCG